MSQWKSGADVVRCLMARARRFHNRFDNRTDPFLDDLPELRDFHDSVRQYKVDRHKMSSRVMLALQDRADIYGASAPLLEFGRVFLSSLRKRDFPAYVHTCWRSPLLQRRLFDEGKSTLRSGAHQRSAAIDIVHGFHHWNLNDDAWRYLGLIGEEVIRQRNLPIRWGGRWTSFPDPAHWELIHWRDLAEVHDEHEPVRFRPFAHVSKWETV